MNDRYELQLDTSKYTLPRVKGGFKGETIPLNMIYTFTTSATTSPTPHTQPPTSPPSEEDTMSIGSENNNNPIYSNPQFIKGNRALVTDDMLRYSPKLNIDWQDIIVLKNYALEKPEILIGWQVSVHKKPNAKPGKPMVIIGCFLSV